ncbi:hypothetical protein D3C81_1852770 [compost metagenome]
MLGDLDNAFGRHPQLLQQVAGEVRAVGLAGDGLFHAQQPGLAVGRADGPAGVELRDDDAAVFLGIQLGAAQPAAEKAGQLVAGRVQILRVHAPDGGGFAGLLHDPVEVVDQALDALDPAGGLERGVADAEYGCCAG